MNTCTKKNIKIVHLSNVAGRLGGGIGEVVQSLMRYQQNKFEKLNLWFIGANTDVGEIARDGKIPENAIARLSIKSFINPLFLIQKKKTN